MRKKTHVRQQRQHLAISALAEGKSPDDAAAAAGVARSTVYRWLDRDDFQRALALKKGEPLPGTSSTPRPLQVRPYDREPEVAEAAAAYMALAREHHGADVPMEAHPGRPVPDPRWFLRMRDSEQLHPQVVEASRRYEKVRAEALRRYREERDGAQAKV